MCEIRYGKGFQRVFVDFNIFATLPILSTTVEPSFVASKYARILAQPYRNRRRRFGLRFNLIAGLYNCGLNFALA